MRSASPSAPCTAPPFSLRLETALTVLRNNTSKPPDPPDTQVACRPRSRARPLLLTHMKLYMSSSSSSSTLRALCRLRRASATK